MGLDVSLPARPESSPEFRRALRGFLEAVVADEPRRDDVLLAAGEAVGNAIEHAYRGSGDGPVSLRASAREGRLVVEVGDRGLWQLEGDPERGRGLGIMRALVDRVEIESTREGTRVRLELALGSGRSLAGARAEHVDQ